ncbi:MAG: hypothetical protein QXF52_08660 [Thermoproteota archaeon]
MTLVSAAVFVYYPIGIAATWVYPLVRFQDPSTSGVSVTLSNDNTTAVVDATTSRDLVLDDRNAYIWDDFNTNPFSAPARLTVVGSCSPGASWDSANRLVRFDATSAASGGWHGDHMVAYYATQTPGGTSRVYLLMRTRVTSSPRRGVWKGFFLFQGSPSTYYYYTYEFWDSTESDGMKIVRFAPGFSYTELATNTVRDNGGWYGQWGVRYISGGYMQYRVWGATSGTLTYTDPTYSNTPSQVGFGGSLDRREVIEFDDFIASADADPLFVNVTNLDPGWTVYLENSGGTVLTSATAGSSGIANLSLSMTTGWIIRNGRLRIMQGSTPIMPSKSFDVIVGGDVYRCISVLTDRNLLAYRNFDNQLYNVFLKLDSYSITGTMYSLNLWVGSGTGTTPIRFVNNINVTSTTSTIPLGSGVTNYIHGNATLTRFSTVVLTLSFHYYIPSSEVEVEYPVTVTIHG